MRTLTKEEINSIRRIRGAMTGAIIGLLENADLVSLKELCEGNYEKGYALLAEARAKATGEARAELDKVWPYLSKDVANPNIVWSILQAEDEYYANEFFA